jgi:hypothetical protein
MGVLVDARMTDVGRLAIPDQAECLDVRSREVLLAELHPTSIIH